MSRLTTGRRGHNRETSCIVMKDWEDVDIDQNNNAVVSLDLKETVDVVFWAQSSTYLEI